MDLKIALENLRSQDYFIWNDFLTSDEVAEVEADYQLFYDQGVFQRAGTGRQETKIASDRGVRSDETLWLEAPNLTKAQKLFWQRFDRIKQGINKTEFLGLWSMEGHYSRYPAQGYYQKHLDRFSANDERTVSVVLYLNANWKKGDGGELRLHFPKSDPATFDIEPIGGRLVCFLSETTLHEVLPSHVVRKSFAGWWKRRPVENASSV